MGFNPRISSGPPAAIGAAHKGRTYDCTRPSCTNAHENSCQPGAFSNRVSFVNGFVAVPGHGSLRGRSNPPQHLVRSTGAAMSTTSWHTMMPLKAHPRSHPYPRPAGKHYIHNLARMNPTNNGVRRRLRG